MKEEGIDLPRGIAGRIAVRTSKNLRQAIHYFEATWKAKLYLVRGKIRN
uniref:Uncharacterized protein n=1 Tax=Triticum urartu TaxID=4572 RepID=A0A8R7TMV2_TRIUA